MNPQYLQQQNSYFGAQQTNSPYGEPNANFPPKGTLDSPNFPPQKPPGAPLPPINAATESKSPLEHNPLHGPPFLPNQNNLADQMSNISLSGPPTSMQNFSQQPIKNIPPSIPFSANGVSNQNFHPSQSESNSNPLNAEKSNHSLPQGPPLSQNSSLPYSPSGPPQFTGPSSNAGTKIPTNTPQPNINQPQSQLPLGFNTNNMPNQTPNPGQQYNSQGGPKPMTSPMAGPPMGNQQNLSGPQAQNPMGHFPVSQQSMSRPPLPGQSNNSAGPPLSTQQNISGPPVSKQQNLMGSPYSGQQNFPGAPIQNQQNFSGPPPLPGQTNLAGPPLPGQPNLAGPPLPGQPNLAGPPLPGQTNFAGPPLPGQPNLSRPPLPGQQQNFQSQGPYQNQVPGQQPYMSGPPLPGQQGNVPYGMNQGFQQPNYGPGQPPVYGNQGPFQPGMSAGVGGFASQQAQQRKIDPDQMPNPIQVIEEDQRLKGGDFITNQKGLVPPLVTTKFVVHDQGNSSPRFIRSSMYTVPTTSDLMKQTQAPFSIILSPMAQIEDGEYDPPIVDMGELGPVRCVRCKAYMCPFMQFLDAGRRFQCMFCKATTEVPQQYFQHLDHSGHRLDRYERPELMLGTFEYLATKDYCKNNTFPNPPAIIFVIDVSYNNIKSGLVNLLCSQIKNIIRNLPIDQGQTKSNMKVGFITYNNSVHFYNCKANLAQPQMMFVGDVQDVFMPLLEGFLCDPEESESTIDNLMTQIPLMFGETRETETILGPAIQAGLEALKASECAGKLLVFHSSLPVSEAPGKLKNRDDRNLLGTDKEKSVLAPQSSFYGTLGQECVGAGCSVDLFLFNNSYIDVATIGQVSRLTGGEIYKYTYFQADIDGERLITDIINNISRPIAFDAVMRVRTSTGVRPTDFYGHLFMSNTTDIELASIDCDKAIAIEIKHDDKLGDDEGVYIQAALLYTSCSGIRRLRVINLSLKTSPQLAELYRSCDLDAMVNFLLKQSISKLMESSTKAIKDSLNSRCATILATYRKHCASPTNAGQLILPESMKLLPLYTNSLLKSDALGGGAGITVDQKSFVMMSVSSMPIIETIVHVYPRLISLHDIDAQSTELPQMMRCSIEKFQDDGVYLLENGTHMFIWLGLSLSPQWVQTVFGVASVVQVDTDKTTIPVLDNSLNKRIRDVIAQVQSERRYCMRLTITRQREKMEMVMRQFLVEDRGTDGSPSYVDYLCHMHREIRNLLS